ncbi:MAG: YhfC family intramembrane metalloprotease [Firmicutes bacterium]|nr:YhfC family intramembrane metalloprotease [Bacillota bacterium]
MVVSTASLAAMFFSLFASLFLPVGLIIYFYRRYRFSVKACFLGAGVFILFQLLLRLPLLNYLLVQPWLGRFSTNIFFYAVVVGGFTAGLFEECGRYLAFQTVLKGDLSWNTGLAYGLGHGGVEAIVLVGFTYINNIVISLMINRGLFEQLIAPRLGAEASLIKAQLVGLPPSVFLAAGVERMLTLIVQLALSLIVLYAVKSRRPVFLLAAILLHTGLNAGVVYLQAGGAAIWTIELFIAAAAAAALYLIIRLKGSLELLENPAEPTDSAVQ